MQNSKFKNIKVIDSEYNELEPTRPGKARKLLNSGKAKLLNEKIPLIQLKKIVKKQEDLKMDLRSIERYFKDNEEVYVQNISGGVVSLTFYDTDGRPEPFSLINDRRPIRLTDYIPKEIIRKSSALRKLLMRRPPVLRLLSEENYAGTITTIAKETDKTPEEVVDELSEKISNRRTKLPESAEEKKAKEDLKLEVIDASEDGGPEGDDLEIPGTVDSGINPRVIQVVADCSDQATKRIKAGEALAEFKNMNLSIDDLNYIIGNCGYRTVVSWAQKEVASVEKSEED
jgi:hypothetical protein